MGFLSGLFRSRYTPTNRTAGSSYSFFMGGSTSGKRVNERTSMQMTAVYSCVRILSEAIASLPLHVYEYTDTGTAKAVNHPLYVLLHDEPNPEMTSFLFRETLMTHLLPQESAVAYKAGQEIALKNAGLYAAVTAAAPVNTVSGTYYLYDGKEIEGFLRICPSTANVEKTPVADNVTGWVKSEDIC